MTRSVWYVLAVSAIATGLTVPVSATVAPAVPEIDGASISAGLGLLAAGVLMLRARRRR
jgi:MYXO-CTERM domain-containing protein